MLILGQSRTSVSQTVKSAVNWWRGSPSLFDSAHPSSSSSLLHTQCFTSFFDSCTSTLFSPSQNYKKKSHPKPSKIRNPRNSTSSNSKIENRWWKIWCGSTQIWVWCWIAMGSLFLVFLCHPSTQEEAARAYDIAAIEYRGINAITNFDLSSYIRWLKPKAGDTIATQELEAVTEPQNMSFMANGYIPADEKSFSHTNPFASDYLNSPRNQEVTWNSINLNTGSKSSSSTAFGLLLQSSIFRELVQKNSNLSEDDSTDDEEPKNQLQAGSDDEYGGIFYAGTGENSYASGCDQRASCGYGRVRPGATRILTQGGEGGFHVCVKHHRLECWRFWWNVQGEGIEGGCADKRKGGRG